MPRTPLGRHPFGRCCAGRGMRTCPGARRCRALDAGSRARLRAPCGAGAARRRARVGCSAGRVCPGALRHTSRPPNRRICPRPGGQRSREPRCVLSPVRKSPAGRSRGHPFPDPMGRTAPARVLDHYSSTLCWSRVQVSASRRIGFTPWPRRSPDFRWCEERRCTVGRGGGLACAHRMHSVRRDGVILMRSLIGKVPGRMGKGPECWRRQEDFVAA